MIIQVSTNNNPYSAEVGNAYQALGPSIPLLRKKEANDICICDFIDCKYIESAFGKNGGEGYQKDFSNFLFRRFIAADTVALELLKEGVVIAQLDDNAFGELTDGYPDGNSEQQLYYNFLIDWTKVLVAHESGYYSIRATSNILGTQSAQESRTFFLLPYDDRSADGTVKIESYQNGNIFGSDFDYTGLNLYQAVRVPGRFGNPVPIYETSRYVTDQQEYKQIKDTMSRVWELNTHLINWEVAETLIYNKLLSNQILITDYTIKAENIWRQISVRLDDIEKPPISLSPDKRYNIKFVDNQLVFQKRNF